jgi:hypothetical protein
MRRSLAQSVLPAVLLTSALAACDDTITFCGMTSSVDAVHQTCISRSPWKKPVGRDHTSTLVTTRLLA